VIGKIETGLKKGLKVLKKWSAQQLQNENRDAIRARGFVWFSL
jgi:hypothetical protein